MPTFDWDALSGEDRFREFCGRLLHHEIGPEVHVYDRKGRDYAIDGDYDGSYGSEIGKWVFQFKWRGDYSSLKSTMKTEVERIGGHRVDGGTGEELWDGVTHYRLLTNITHSPQNRHELLSILEPLGLNSDVWFAGKLEEMCSGNPYVGHDFFGVDRPLLFPPFEAREYHTASGIAGEYYLPENLPYVSQTDLNAAIDDFLAQSEARILVLTGPPGVGKSRAVIELGERLDNEGQWLPLVAMPSDARFGDHLDELPPEGDYVIFVDTPEECGYLEELLRTVTQDRGHRDRCKIVLAMKPAMPDEVKQAMRVYPSDKRRHVEIAPSDEVVEEIVSALGIPDPQRRRIVTMARGIPIWAVLAADVWLGEDGGQVLSARAELVERYLEAGTAALAASVHGNRKLARLALASIAALQPVNVGSDTFVNALAGLAEVESYEASEAAQAAKGLELVTTRGRLSGIIPEVLAQEVLVRCFYGADEEPTGLHDRVIVELSRVNPRSLFGNLARAETAQGQPLLDEAMSQAISEIGAMGNVQRYAVLTNLSGLVAFRPLDYLSLCGAVLERPQPDEQYEYEWGSIPMSHSISHRDVVARMLQSLSDAKYTLGAVGDMLRVVGTAAEEFGDDQVIWQTCQQLARDAAEYGSEKPLEFNREALLGAERWVEETGSADGASARLRLALMVAKTLLRPEFSDTSFDRRSKTVSFTNRVMLPTEETLGLWSSAAQMVSRIASLSDPDIRVAAVEVLTNALWACSHRWRETDGAEEPEQAEQWNAETARRFTYLADLAREDLPARAMVKLEESVSHWSERAGSVGSEEISGLLERLRAKPDYMLYRGLVGTALGLEVEDADPDPIDIILQKTPEDAADAMLGAIRETEEGSIYGGIRWAFRRLGEEHPDFALEVFDAIAGDAEGLSLTAHYLGELLAGLREERLDLALSRARNLAEGEDVDGWRVAAGMYEAMGPDTSPESMGPEDVELCSSLGEKMRDVAPGAFLEALPVFARCDREFFEESVLQVAEVTDERVAGALLKTALVTPLEPVDPEHVGFLKRVVASLLTVADLGRTGVLGFSYLERVLEAIAGSDIVWVVDFFQQRLETAAQADDYDAVPFQIDRVLTDISKSEPGYSMALRRVRSWVLESPWHRLDAPRFYRFLANPEGVSGAAGDVLGEWVVSGSVEELMGVARLLAEFPLSSELADVVADVVVSASSLPAEDEARVHNELMAAIATYGGVVAIGTDGVSPHDRRMKELFEELKQRREEETVRSFCDRVIDSAERDMRRDRERNEEERYW